MLYWLYKVLRGVVVACAFRQLVAALSLSCFCCYSLLLRMRARVREGVCLGKHTRVCEVCPLVDATVSGLVSQPWPPRRAQPGLPHMKKRRCTSLLVSSPDVCYISLLTSSTCVHTHHPSTCIPPYPFSTPARTYCLFLVFTGRKVWRLLEVVVR